MTIKAIPTTYSGVKFRSKLEASAAMFFDENNIKWIYESEGFDINGTWYLPDFWLPELESFIEVKGIMDESVKKPIALAKHVQFPRRVFLASSSDVDSWRNDRGGHASITRLGVDDLSSGYRFGQCETCGKAVLVPKDKKHCPAFYLAGKVRPPKDWRYEIYPSLAWVPPNSEIIDEWRTVVTHENGAYCGPFFINKTPVTKPIDDFNYGEPGQDHCSGPGGYKPHDGADGRRGEVLKMCQLAIADCDAMFVWLDDATAYGTLVEIGIAIGRRKPLYIGGCSNDEMWFASRAGLSVPGRPAQAFQYALEHYRGATWRDLQSLEDSFGG